MKFTTALNSQVDFSHLQGKICATYQQLVATFGEPAFSEPGDKVDAEWMLEFEDGTIATIYNWKNGPSYLGEHGIPVEQITEWHVGGFERTAVNRVHDAVHLVDTLV